jgi:hypothetical protein
MIRHEAKDIKTLWDHAYFGIINDEPGVVDHFARNIFHSFGNVLTAQECFFDFDLGDIGLTPTKWTKFTGQYVDVESLHAWINNAMNVKTYDSLWQFKDIPPNFGGRKAVHQWGKCLLAFSFRREPSLWDSRALLTTHSLTSWRRSWLSAWVSISERLDSRFIALT